MLVILLVLICLNSIPQHGFEELKSKQLREHLLQTHSNSDDVSLSIWKSVHNTPAFKQEIYIPHHTMQRYPRYR